MNIYNNKIRNCSDYKVIIRK